MKALSWSTNHLLVSTICVTPILLSCAHVYAEDMVTKNVEPAPTYTLTYNLGIYSHYTFRGVEYSDGPALQGGLDWVHNSGFYLGTWASNIDAAAYGENAAIGSDGNHIETDFYAGYAHTFKNGIGVNLMGNYFAYLEGKKAHNFDDAANLTGDHQRKINSFETSIAFSYSNFTYTYFYLASNYFGLDKMDSSFNRIQHGNTSGADYNELKVSHPLPFGDLILGAKVGYQHTPGLEGSQGDYAIGLTRRFAMPGAGKATDGWSVNATYTSTFAVQNQDFYTSSEGRDLNESQLTFYIKRVW